MVYECKICKYEPKSHSFENLGKVNGITYLYTCPAKAIKYYDHDGILNHYDGILNDLNGKRWCWIFDARGFSLKHYLEIKTAIDLAKLISNHYGESLVTIYIYKPSWHLKLTLNMVWGVLSQHLRSIIMYVDRLPYKNIFQYNDDVEVNIY